MSRYQKHVQRLNEETELSSTKQAVEDQKREEKLTEIKDEDIEMLVSTMCCLIEKTLADSMHAQQIQQTGLKREDVQELFLLAGSNKLEDACRAYLHPESFNKAAGTAVESAAHESQDVAVAA